MNRKKFIEHLKIGDMLFTKNELKTCLIEQMLDYIEKRIALYELIELSETIRRRYLSQASNDVINVVNKLHEIHEDLHDPTKKQLTEEEIIFKVDDFLVSLT